MNYNEIISSIYTKIKSEDNIGDLANYIPELAKVNPEKFGVHLSILKGEKIGMGDYQEKFSIQSIAKVFSLCMAFEMLGEKIWDRMGVEPSGTAFNSLVQLEKEKGIPRNPFINAGALVICDILISHLKKPMGEFLDFVRFISGNPQLNYSPTIANSEKASGYLNNALCYFIKSYGNIHNNPTDVLDFYFHLCSLEMSCEELSGAFMFLANEGMKSENNQVILSKSQTKRINALMQTCGLYDESGEFAFKIGLPGKSGVGGGIIAIYPKQYSIAVWSPFLNTKGNSHRAIKFLEQFTTRTQLSIF